MQLKGTYFNPFLGKLIFVIWAFLGDIFNAKIFDISPSNSHEHLMSFCYIKTKEPLHPAHTFSSTLYKYLNTCAYSCRGTIDGVGSENICSALVTFFQFLGHRLSTLSFTCVFFSLQHIHISTLSCFVKKIRNTDFRGRIICLKLYTFLQW